MTLHIYDVFSHTVAQVVNQALKPLGTGAFHAGVEVYGQEWSFGYVEGGATGVFACPPRGCEAHRYRESLPMGTTQLSEVDVESLLSCLSREWPGESYDLLRRNCCTFSNHLCLQLGVGPIPQWVTNLAGAGATLQHGFQAAASQAQAAAILAAAKAGQVDERFRITGTAQATARELLARTRQLDQRYSVTATAAEAAAQAVTQARELDAKYGISLAAMGVAARASVQAASFLEKLRR